MSTREKNWFILPVGLIFLVLMGMILWMVSTILNFELEAELPEPHSVTETPRHLHEPASGPVSETLIRIDEEEMAPSNAAIPAGKEPAPPAAFVSDLHGNRHIPAICENYGPQIQAREAFNYPLIHQAMVGPTRITVHLILEQEGP